MKLLITGATGTAGSEVLNEALRDESVESVLVLSRRELDVGHEKLKVVLHTDFLHYDGLESELQKCDACIWCLGISQSQVNKKEYQIITHDYTLAAAQALVRNNPYATFVFLSGAGADSSEKSRTRFARVKGKTENALMKMNLGRLVIARPGGIKPTKINPNTSLFNKMAVPLFPIMEWLTPRLVITAHALAIALIHAAKFGAPKTILENTDLKNIAAGK